MSENIWEKKWGVDVDPKYYNPHDVLHPSCRKILKEMLAEYGYFDMADDEKLFVLSDGYLSSLKYVINIESKLMMKLFHDFIKIHDKEFYNKYRLLIE